MQQPTNLICFTCRSFEEAAYERGPHFCRSPKVIQIGGRRGTFRLSLPAAREICDKEQDGHFVYFEEKEESAQ